MFFQVHAKRDCMSKGFPGLSQRVQRTVGSLLGGWPKANTAAANQISGLVKTKFGGRRLTMLINKNTDRIAQHAGGRRLACDWTTGSQPAASDQVFPLPLDSTYGGGRVSPLATEPLQSKTKTV